MEASKKSDIRFPIGVQDFSKLRMGNYLYVDKTEYVYDLVNRYNYIFLSRPRRFGKSLLSSTFQCYLEGRKELFEGLKIMNLEEKWEQHPVLHFDFSKSKYTSISELNDNLDKQLFMYEQIYGRGEKDTGFNLRLEGLVTRAYEQTGHKVGLIIDEYDAPMLHVLHNSEYLSEVRNVMRNFFSPIKSLDYYLKFTFMTGITKFAQLSIFSELNNLKDISMMPDYSAVCGISKSELYENLTPYVKDMAEAMCLTEDEMFSKLAEYYDGYHFSRIGEDMYNPFSLINALSDKDVQPYWFSSGTPTFLINYMAEHPIDETSLDNMTTMPIEDFDVSPEVSHESLPLLYQSGYLTIKDYDRETHLYTLGYPNKEVKLGFEKCLLNYYNGKNQTGNSFVSKFYIFLKDNNIEGALCLMQTYFSSIPYDLQNKKEKHFQTIFYLIFSLLGQYIKTEVKTATGRVDAVATTADTVYLFEMKVDKSAEEALQQINDKGYLIPYKLDGRQVVKVGLNFSTTTRTLQEWIVE